MFGKEYKMINAKSGLMLSQILDRMGKGAEGIEIQLVEEFDLLRHTKEGFQSYIDPQLLSWMGQKEQHNGYIEAVHAPLVQQQDYVIEFKESEGVIRQSAALAQWIAEVQHKDVSVIVHTREDVERLRSYGRLEEIQRFVNSLLTEYPNISLLFENLTFLTFSPKLQGMEIHSPFQISNGTIRFSNIELVKCLDNPRCGTVIDTCHVIMTQNLFANWREYYQTDVFNINVMEAIFQQSKPYNKLIHLNNAISHGQQQFHGLPFQEERREDMEKLNQIMRLYRQYGNSCAITIEVREEDYNNAVNFQTTLHALQQWL